MSKGLLAAIAVFTVGVAAPSYAADMPVKAAPSYVAAPGYSWTGFYIGGHVGGGWAHSQSTTTDTSTNFPAGFTRPAFDNASWLAGGQAGFNWQFAPQWVVGVEGEWSWLGIATWVRME